MCITLHTKGNCAYSLLMITNPSGILTSSFWHLVMGGWAPAMMEGSKNLSTSDVNQQFHQMPFNMPQKAHGYRIRTSCQGI